MGQPGVGKTGKTHNNKNLLWLLHILYMIPYIIVYTQ